MFVCAGALDLTSECQQHEAHAPHFYPRGGGHDPSRGSERGRHPSESLNPLHRTGYICEFRSAAISEFTSCC